MTAEQLLQELKIRFNTEPKRYEKRDYQVLLNLLLQLTNTTNNCTCDTKELNAQWGEITGDMQDQSDLITTLANKQDKEDGNLQVQGADGVAITNVVEAINELSTRESGGTVVIESIPDSEINELFN